MTITPGKYWRMRRLADDNGRFKMLAMDQTGPIVNPIKEIRKTDKAPFADVSAVKSMLGRYLAPKASAVLVDAPYGYAPTIADIPARTGLLIGTEWATWQTLETGRKSSNVPGWDPSVIRTIGGDGVKVNLWYRADASEDVKQHQLCYLNGVKKACRENDIPFILEYLVYPFPSESQEEFLAKRIELVKGSLADKAIMDPEGVDVFKLEPPTETINVPDPDGPEASKIQARFDDMAKDLGRPWVLLSAGSTPEDFVRLLTYAYRAGANGYLAGRAIWLQPFSNFPDISKMEKELSETAPALMDQLNAMTDEMATPWTEAAPWNGKVEMAPGGETFANDYSSRLAAGF
ncbi:tagatose 1,6-diphosphate aldolase [uncultured Cohaesibacter sp.]|uniref:tagatose 1,6-diphosphate aldolase n=1 Tax=uncultured Cohaesibacter sp. TaxID=1002546 RepID=UPI0029308C0B|nr:tagatose 1,6-diphosphate aldolase [uncultured Cohaesibacter sp.]